MNSIISIRRHIVAITLRSLCMFSILSLFVIEGSMAQTISATDGSTASGLKPGAPAGSYALSGFENVNLYNGNVNFNLPLLKIGGRGGTGTAVTVSLNSVKWTVENYTIEGTEIAACGIPNSPIESGCYRPPYDAPSGSDPQPQAYPNPELWGGLRVGYGPGVLQGRYTANTMGALTKSLIRLTFTAPGGTEYELRDLATNGRPYGAGGFGWTPPSNHGMTYVSEDGTITFTPDQQIVFDFGRGTGLISSSRMTGYLYSADGMRYRIENGLVMWTRDRNGNQLTFTYYNPSSGPLALRRVSTITDSMGRVTNIYYADSTTDYDRIVFKAFGGINEQTIKVYRKHLSQALRTTRTGDSSTTKTYGDLFLELEAQGDIGDDMYDPADVISEIKLPDNRSYKLYYNIYNELARVELPTGGAIEYDYTPTGSSVHWGGFTPQIHRRVTERRLYSDGTSSAYESRQTYTPTFTVTASSGSTPIFWETSVEVKQYGASGGPLSSEKHTFFWSPIASMYKSPVSYSGWKEGKVKKTELFDAAGTALRRVENTWEQCAQCELDMSWWTPTDLDTTDHAPSNNPHITASVTTLLDGSENLVSKQTFQYDKYNNLTDTFDYDYNPTVAATYPVRHTKTDYLTTSAYTATPVHLRGLPTMQRVYSVNTSSGAETLVAKSETVYDESTYQVAESYSGLTGWTDPGSARGNATTSRAWYDVSSSNSYIEIHVQFDQLGNVRKTWDGRGKESEIQYSADYKYSLPTKSIAPDPDGTTGPTSALETNNLYDFSTGLPTSTTDANNQTTGIEYNDVLSRPTKVTRPTGGGWTSFTYGDSVGSLCVRTQTALDASRVIEGYQYFDGLGRTWRSSQTDGATSILVDTQYDALGRVWKVSNPYRSGDTVQWTTTSYGALGRVTSVKTPDNAEVLTAYSGNTVTVTDQAGKQRKSVTDALGRLTSVYEAPNDTTNFNFQTSYKYDVLGNLRTVTQGSQKRYFLYDSLSRLIRVRNPELNVTSSLDLSSDALTENNGQWSLAYAYDNDGNLLTKTDARNATATYVYDGLNRVTQRSYSGGTAVATPTVNYAYDTSGVSNSKGRLTSVSSSVSAYNYTGYDALGRVTASQQVTDGQTYSMSYEYDLAGNMTSQTYPTGREVTQSFDNAGRLASINGHVSGSAAKTYANSFGYTPHGAVERMRLGNGRWEHSTFNNRLQPTEIGLGSSATDSSILRLNYEYGDASNNGNVLKQIITVPTIGSATGFTATQNYQYDQLNRLTGAQEVNGTSTGWQSSGTFWQQKFSYDQYGNRTVDTANTTSTMIGPNPQISTATNRITPRSGEYYDFDATGNMNKGQTGETLDYDAESKLVRYQGGATQSGGADFSYDGDGRRVKKANASETLIFVYNISGQLVAEYTTSTPEQNGTSYLTSDTLGTPRINTKSDGKIMARHDYLPFGEELYAGSGNRTGNPGQAYDLSSSPADKTKQKFTQKERDNESGLDFFEARYYASAHGRFTSTDPILVTSDRLVDPQEVNLYHYARNNPLRYTDPTGEDIDDSSLDDNKDYQKWKAEFLATKAGREQWDRYDLDRDVTVTISMGELPEMNGGAVTRDFKFDENGKLTGASIVLGTEFAKDAPGAVTYPITGSLTPTNAHGAPISREARAVGILAHEFGHLNDAQSRGAAFAKEYALMEQNKGGYLEMGQDFFKTDQFRNIVSKLGADPGIVSGRNDIVAERATIPVLRQYFGKGTGHGSMPGRVKDAIQKFEKAHPK